jgi:hypothetical protein
MKPTKSELSEVDQLLRIESDAAYMFQEASKALGRALIQYDKACLKLKEIHIKLTEWREKNHYMPILAWLPKED